MKEELNTDLKEALYEQHKYYFTGNGTAGEDSADGDTIHIENLPYGVEYKVSETPVADYVTTETGTEGEVDEAVEQANFTNTKGGAVDAGVVLDSAPYLFTLTGAAGIGLLLTLRRRHQK